MSSEALCAAAGLGALAFLYTYNRRAAPPYGPSACASARASRTESDDVVSARAAAAGDEAGGEETEIWWPNMPLSEGYVAQFDGAAPATSGRAAASNAMRTLVKDTVYTGLSQPNLSKEKGHVVLVAGRAGSDSAPKPKATGGLMFGMSESYAEALEADA